MDARTRLRWFFTEQARMFCANPPMTIMLLPEDIFRNNQALQEKISVMREETGVFIETLLVAGISDGTFRQKTDPETLALMLIGGFRLLVSSWRLQKHSFSLEDRTQRFMNMVMPLISD